MHHIQGIACNMPWRYDSGVHSSLLARARNISPDKACEICGRWQALKSIYINIKRSNISFQTIAFNMHPLEKTNIPLLTGKSAEVRFIYLTTNPKLTRLVSLQILQLRIRH